MRSLNDSVITMSSKDVVVTHLLFLIDTMIRIGTLATTECTLVCLYHIRYNALANQMKSFPHNKGQRHEDGLQMGMSSDSILLNILRWSFLLL